MNKEFEQKTKLLEPEELLTGNPSFGEIAQTVVAPVETDVAKTPLAWRLCFSVALALLGMFIATVIYLLVKGIGIWGNSDKVGWAWDITNFVWWVGIGHAGTLISAILFLFRQPWRTAINRFAEAMTIFAVLCALMFPILHTGRPWFAIYYLFPLPNQMGIYPNFRSPLTWDMFALTTYFTVSLIFWYVGLLPDLAALRDRSKNKIRGFVYGVLAMGWRGANKHWQHYETAYLIFAALSTPLVLSVHSIVSFDFATSQTPGWHTTIFPPYFVAGAVFSGFGMVMTLLLIARQALGFKRLVSMRVLENMNKIILLTGMMVGFAYLTELFIAWYSGNHSEQNAFYNRLFGPYAWAYWSMMFCNLVAPQVFWFKKLRRSIPVMFVVSILVNIGMWFERFVIIVTSLHRSNPSSWDYYYPTWLDVSMYLGTFGLFFTLFLLFLRFLPAVAMAEIKATKEEANPHSQQAS